MKEKTQETVRAIAEGKALEVAPASTAALLNSIISLGFPSSNGQLPFQTFRITDRTYLVALDQLQSATHFLAGKGLVKPKEKEEVLSYLASLERHLQS